MADNISLLAVSEAGGGAGGGVYTLDTVPIYPNSGLKIKNWLAHSNNTTFYTGEANNRDLNGSPSCFYGTKSTGWTTVFNHSGSGSLIWFCTTSFCNYGGRVILKVTVDGEVREVDITMGSSADSDYYDHRIFMGNLITVNSSGVYRGYNAIQYQGNFGAYEYINSTFTASGDTNHFVPLSTAGAMASGLSPLKYETNLKIEVYNSTISTASAGNYYGGMVIQGY